MASILKKLLQTDEGEKNAPAKNEAAPVAATAPSAPGEPKRARSLLVRPLITEKASMLMTNNQYVFQVRPEANKITVAIAVEEMYNVKPLSVRIVNTSDKKRVRGRMIGRVSGWKKAIVTLPEGKTIHVNEGGA